MSIRLIAFDLDGTFLADDKSIPEENLRAIGECASRGIHIVPATGRIVPGLPESIRSLPFIRYYITSNGAYVVDIQTGEALHRAELDTALALDVMRYLDGVDAIYDCYKDNRGWMTRSFLEHVGDFVQDPIFLEMIHRLRTPVDSLPEMLRTLGEPIQKISVFPRHPERDKRAVMEELARRFPTTRVSSSVPFNIEVNSAAATKGQALRGLCARLGIDIAETMGFGDGTNDADLLTAAGIGVAMANAEPEVRAAADYITDTNNNAGVAKAIRKFAG